MRQLYAYVANESTHNSIPNILNLLTKKFMALIHSVTICEQKTKDCAPKRYKFYSAA